MSGVNENDVIVDNKACRVFATLISACICSYLLYLTGGERGIGWFVFSLVFIWG